MSRGNGLNFIIVVSSFGDYDIHLDDVPEFGIIGLLKRPRRRSSIGRAPAL